jgi:hypothetical protein
MKPQSAKAKGRNLQKWVRERLLTLFPQLEEDDVRSTSMGNQGEDVQLSPAARKLIPVVIECKNLAKFVGYTYMSQATMHLKSKDINITPIVVIKANHQRPLVIVDAEYFFNMHVKDS